MRSMKWRRVGVYGLVVLPIIGVGGITVLAHQQDGSQQQTGDPVADAARKAREQKKTAPKPKKVFTNEDVSSGGGSSSSATASSTNSNAKENTEGQASTDNAPAAKSSGPRADEEQKWKKRFQEAREKLANAEKELDILQREQQKALTQYYSDPTKAMKEQLTRKDVNDKDSEIAAKKQEVADLRQKLSDLEDELRKSGGEIGWSRP
jgi:chromosome segregation ATPase